MILGAVLAVVFAAGAGAGAVWLVGEDRAGWGRVLQVPQAAAQRMFPCALMSAWGNATWPPAQLEFFDWGIRLSGGTHPARRLIPVWDARYEELDSSLAIP